MAQAEEEGGRLTTTLRRHHPNATKPAPAPHHAYAGQRANGAAADAVAILQPAAARAPPARLQPPLRQPRRARGAGLPVPAETWGDWARWVGDARSRWVHQLPQRREQREKMGMAMFRLL